MKTSIRLRIFLFSIVFAVVLHACDNDTPTGPGKTPDYIDVYAVDSLHHKSFEDYLSGWVEQGFKPLCPQYLDIQSDSVSYYNGRVYFTFIGWLPITRAFRNNNMFYVCTPNSLYYATLIEYFFFIQLSLTDSTLSGTYYPAGAVIDAPGKLFHATRQRIVEPD